MKKTYKLILRIKPEHNPPDLGKGKGPGVLATQELTLGESDIKTYGLVFIAAYIVDVKQALINRFIEVIQEEVPNEKEHH